MKPSYPKLEKCKHNIPNDVECKKCFHKLLGNHTFKYRYHRKGPCKICGLSIKLHNPELPIPKIEAISNYPLKYTFFGARMQLTLEARQCSKNQWKMRKEPGGEFMAIIYRERKRALLRALKIFDTIGDTPHEQM